MIKVGSYQLESIVLNKTEYRDNDLIIGFLSREYGKVRGLARHGKKSRKRFGNVLAPSTVVEFEFKVRPGRDLVWLEKGSLIKSHEGLGANIKLLGMAGLALELVDGFCKPYDPAEEIYLLLLWTLEHLDRNRNPEESLFIFQTKLMSTAGFEPLLTQCVLCGRPVDESSHHCLSPRHSGLTCSRCATGGFTVSPGTLKTMILIQKMPLEKVNRARVGQTAIIEAQPFLMACFRWILGKDFRSAGFLEKISKV